MQKTPILIAAALTAGNLLAAWQVLDNTWQAAAGDYSGDVTNALHWSKGHFPERQITATGGTNAELAVFSVAPGAPYTVTFPKGEMSSRAGLQVRLADGMDLTVDGSETVFRHDPEAWDRYPLRIGIGTSKFLWTSQTGYLKDGNGVLSNFVYRAAMSGDSASVELQKGTYDYVTPTMSFPWNVFTDGAVDTQRRIDVTVASNVTVRTGAVKIGGTTAMTNVFAASGAAFDIRGGLSCYFAGNHSRCQEVSFTDGSTVAVSDSLAVTGTKGRSQSVRFADATVSANTLSLSGGGSDNRVAIADSTVTLDRQLIVANAQLEVVRSDVTALVPSGADAIDIYGGASTTTEVSFVDSQIHFTRHWRIGSVDSKSRTRVNLLRTDAQPVSGSSYYQLYVRGDADVSLSDSTVKVKTLEMADAASAAEPLMHVTDGTFNACNGNSFIGMNGRAQLTLDGTARMSVQAGSLYLGGNDPNGGGDFASSIVTGVLTVAENARYEAGGTRIALGACANAYGVLNVRDNAYVYPGNVLQVGRCGTGFLNVEGGTVALGNAPGTELGLTVAGDTAKTPGALDLHESVLKQTGGEIWTGETFWGLTIAIAAGRKGRAILDGGDLYTAFAHGGIAATCRGGTGWAALEADGGTLHARAATSELVRYFDEAKLGEKGLTVDSDYAVTIPQDFTDKAGATGKGALILTGAGAKTLAMTTSAPSVVVAANGGDVSFAAGAALPKTLVVTNGTRVVLSGAVTLANLTVGTDDSVGVLVIDPTTKLTVTGNLDIRNLQIVLTGDFSATGTSYDLIDCPNGVSSASAGKWLAAFTTAGLAAGTSCTFERVNGAGSAAKLRMNVVAGDTIEIRVDEGDETHTTNVLYNATQKLRTVVADEASLTLTGRLGYGTLEKTGAGTLYLTGLENVFYPGLSLVEGVLVVTDALQLGNDHVQNVSGPVLRGGTLVVQGADAVTIPQTLKLNGTETTTLVEVTAKTDVTMPMVDAVQGALRKRGPGTLVVAASENGQSGTFTGTAYNVPKTPNEAMTVYNDITVQEGELVFRGTKPGVTNSLTAHVDVGVPGEAGATGKVQPRMVVDNLALSLPNRYLTIGAALIHTTTNVNSGAQSSVANTFVTDPRLIVTNGAYLSIGYLQLMTHGGDSTHFRHLMSGARVEVDASTINAGTYAFSSAGGGQTSLAAKGSDGCYGHHLFRNHASLWANLVQFSGTCGFTMEDSYLGANATAPTVLDYATNEITSRLDIVRSTFNVSLVHRALAGYQCRYYQAINFEDALWCCGDRDLQVGATNVNLNLYVRGRGLRFAPYAGRTYTVIKKLRGTGGIVMEGPGTLRFGRSQYLTVEQADPVEMPGFHPNWDTKVTDTAHYHPCTLAYTGATEVNGGTVDFGGFTITNLTLTGTGGTLVNATAVDATLANTNLTYAADFAFAGRTRVDFTDIELPEGQPAVIGRYEGTAPDVTLWRGKGLRARGQKATFSAADGEILATARAAGLAVIVR